MGRALHDVAMGCFMFGWLPPLRPFNIRTLLVPSFKGPCPCVDCQYPDQCKGNRLYITNGNPLGKLPAD